MNTGSFEYEECERSLGRLCGYYDAHRGDRNEATTRSHLIDSLLYDCLGWAKRDVIPETCHEGQYADYTLFAPRAVMVLEAKREGEYYEVPAGKTHITYVLSSLCRGNASLSAAVKQVCGYCHARGIALGAVSNGHQMVPFVANRTDGIPLMDGKAIVFPSLAFIQAHFLDFWNALSRPAVEEGRLHRRLLGTSAPRLPATLASEIPSYPGTKGRNPFQADLKVLTEIVIEDIPQSRHLEDRFLRECYCASGALSKDSLASKSILKAHYAGLFDESAPGPTTVPASRKLEVAPELLADSLSRRPVLLLGDVGVGKSIFIRRLIKIDAADVVRNSIVFYIDFGSQANLTPDLSSFIVDEMYRQLKEEYHVNVEAYNIVREVYKRDVQDFRDGIYSKVREMDEPKFREKEAEFLERKIADRGKHLKKSLEHVYKARTKQIVLFLDNCDQRGPAVENELFLNAQEIAQHWPALVFVPLRPETFHRSRRDGALMGYHPRAFTIAPPRVAQVIRKRLEFAVNILSGTIPMPALPADSSSHISDLQRLLECFLSSLRNNRQLVECIENLTGSNVRFALDLTREFFGSGHVDTRKIVCKIAESGHYTVPIHEFLRAVIYGDSVHYSPRESPVANLFEVSTYDPREHFLLPALLAFLREQMHGEAEAGFVDTDRIYENCQGFGFTPEQIDYAIVRAHRKRLVETVGRDSPAKEGSGARAIRITSVGHYHVVRLCRMFTYVDAMVVATPILDATARENIGDVSSISDRLVRAGFFCSYMDEQWKKLDASSLPFRWHPVSRALRRDIEEIQARVAHS